MKLQSNEDEKIVWSRPPDADATIPVTLMHPVFRQFVDNCQNHRPNKEDNTLVLELMITMSRFFRDENARAATFRDILTRHGIPVGTATIQSTTREFHTDGSIAIDGHLIAIFELKKEIGSEGAEPYAQVILYYAHSTTAKAKAETREFFNFPSFLITVFGQSLLSLSLY